LGERKQRALHRLVKDDPAKLAQIAYGLLLRDVFVRVEDQRTPGNLDTDAYAATAVAGHHPGVRR
jgi:hypothetical protein